jgi:alanine racemase
VNLANLRHNLRVVQRTAGVPVWAVLKADAYGHGSKAVARTLERAGCAGICVALLEEAIELRNAGIRAPILVVGGAYDRATAELLHHQLTPVVHDAAQLEALASEVRYAGVEPLGIHMKIDTGMSRLGATPREVRRLGELLVQHPELRLDGLMTHFACADAGGLESVEEQLRIFDAASSDLAELGLRPRVRHAANSAACFRSDRARLDMVRPGIALFGVEPCAGLTQDLRPVMSIRSEVVALREIPVGQSVGYGATWTASRPTRIATIPMGYADGLSRSLSNRGAALIRGKRAPIVGVVSMDMCMLDVTDLDGVKPGDEVVVMGAQKGPLGADSISATEIADQLGTIPWEILTSVSRRVPRFYREP